LQRRPERRLGPGKAGELLKMHTVFFGIFLPLLTGVGKLHIDSGAVS
jgi:hypothetical protein